MSTESKCEEIIRAILERCNSSLKKTGSKDWTLAFGPDWGGFGLTIYDSESGHTHIGGDWDGCTFDTLINDLHGQLVSKRGLSWVKAAEEPQDIRERIEELDEREINRDCGDR